MGSAGRTGPAHGRSEVIRGEESCAAGGGDLVVQPLLLETSRPFLTLSGVDVL